MQFRGAVRQESCRVVVAHHAWSGWSKNNSTTTRTGTASTHVTRHTIIIIMHLSLPSFINLQEESVTELEYIPYNPPGSPLAARRPPRPLLWCCDGRDIVVWSRLLVQEARSKKPEARSEKSIMRLDLRRFGRSWFSYLFLKKRI